MPSRESSLLYQHHTSDTVRHRKGLLLLMQQLRFRDLIEDSLFKAWFYRRPALADVTMARKWRVYVQKQEDGPWGRRDFRSWKKAMKFVKKIEGRVWDLALNCPSHPTRQPIVKTGRKTPKGLAVRELWVIPSGHRWCDYCRRPTMFRYFGRHHSVPRNIPVIPYIRMCSICGCKEDFLLKPRIPRA